MGCCYSIQSRSGIARQLKKNAKEVSKGTIHVDIDELFETALSTKQIPYYIPYAFPKKKGDHVVLPSIVVSNKVYNPIVNDISDVNFEKLIAIYIEDDERIWKCLNLIGYIGCLSDFVNNIEDLNLRKRCIDVLRDNCLSYKTHTKNSLINMKDVAFILNFS